jgi:hypothetical protein
MSESSILKKLDVLVFQEQGFYVAQCVNLDVVAQAETIRGLKEAFRQQYINHIVVALGLDETPFANLKPPPGIYWKRYRTAEWRINSVDLTQHEEIPREIRAWAKGLSDINFAIV